jgi:hypothetical protein
LPPLPLGREEAVMNLSDSNRFSRQVAGGAMILAPVVLVLAESLHARLQTDPAGQFAAVADDTARWYAAHALILLALALLVPAFVGVVDLARRSRPLLAHVALIVFFPGLIALAAIVGMELVLWQMAQPEASRAEMISLLERLNGSAGIEPLFAVALLFPFAWLLGGLALYVSRAAPVWAAAAIGLSQPVGFIGELAEGPKALAVAAQLVFAIGLVPIGVQLLRRPDERWENTPATVAV